MSASFKQHGLVADFWPNIRLMQLFGHFLFEYHEDNSGAKVILRKTYASITCILILAHYLTLCVNIYLESAAGGDMAADSITCLFFLHCIVKFLYFAFRNKLIYETLASWDSVNSHPLFAESHARHRATAVSKSRKLLLGIVCVTIITIIAWTTSTFFGESVKTIRDPENVNETITVDIPRLPIHAFYPWNAMTGMPYVFSFLYQLYWLTMTLFHANLFDLLFCALLIFACEQLQHVKDVMKPLMELSSATDNYNPSNMDLFRGSSPNRDDQILSKDEQQINIRGIYSNIRDFGMNGNANGNGAINTINGGPNGFSKKQEMLVRSAIKYWVERHKHIVRYVDSIGDAYGVALLLHMLISTVALTLLAYQATKIDGVNLYSMSVIGYLLYSLGQVFAFCVYGNQLIEESSSVMESAYNCQWYDGSEEAKTFVQIVCQQCQKSLSISGAKFFTVSLDLFASVLGAVVTYFMVLVQLK